MIGDCGVTGHHRRLSRTYLMAAEEKRQTEGMAHGPSSCQISHFFHLHTTSSLWVLGNTPDPNQGSIQPTTGPSASPWLHPPSHGQVLPLLPITPACVTVSHQCGKGKGERKIHTICFVDIGLQSLLRRSERTRYKRKED